MERVKQFILILVHAINNLSYFAVGCICGAIAMYIYATAQYEVIHDNMNEEMRKIEDQLEHAKQWECFELKFTASKMKDELQECRQALNECNYGFKQCKFLYKKGSEVCLPE